MEDVRLLIPRSKMDVERAEAAVAAGFPTIEPILYELFEWLQDMNWLVAQILAPTLASVGKPLIPHIQRIFETDDEIWKYWIMREIFCNSEDVAIAFKDELKRIAFNPSTSELEEEINEDAEYVLKKYGWV